MKSPARMTPGLRAHPGPGPARAIRFPATRLPRSLCAPQPNRALTTRLQRPHRAQEPARAPAARFFHLYALLACAYRAHRRCQLRRIY